MTRPPDSQPATGREDPGATLDAADLRAAIEMQFELAAVGHDLQAVMQRIADRTRELTGGTAAAVRMLDGDDVVCGATSGAPEIGLPQRLPLSNNFAGNAMRSGRSLLCVDTEEDARVDSALSRRRNVRSIIAVPLLHAGRSVGLLLLYGREPGAFGERHVTLMELLSVVLSAAMAHAAEVEAKRDQIQALARFETTFAHSPTAMILMDAAGCIVEANPAAQELLGHDAAALRGSALATFIHRDDLRPARASFIELLGGEGDALRLDHRVLRGSEVRWVDTCLSTVRDSDGQPSFAIAMMQDVTDRKAAQDALVAQAEINEHQALHDALTGLANRLLFRDRIEQALAAARRSEARAAVLVMDLDRFKDVNDSLGHAAGDELLVALSARLTHALRVTDTVARLGGDEFGLLLTDAQVPGDVLAAVERVRAALEEPVVVDGLPLAVEASIGIALFPDDGDDVDTLLQRADVAMYHAKSEHCGFAFYTAGRAELHPARVTLVAELRRALEERELTLFYQPKARLGDGAVHGVEALLRWRHPVRGLLEPDDFIPLAQGTGLIKPLTLYVIGEALRQARAWHAEGLELSIAVNLATRNLLDVNFPDQVAELLARWAVDPAVLTFEVTEAALLADPARTRGILERLAALGIRLSIDDFGTGYSSLASLGRLPVSELKIDRSFVMAMERSEDDAAIVRATIDLGRNLGLTVVAEGVESQSIWDRLKALGCSVAQGYVLTPPVRAQALTAWLAGHRAQLVAAGR